jgi:hypothetical protein
MSLNGMAVSCRQEDPIACCVSGGYRMVVDQFQQRLLDRIDQEIAEAERLLRLQSQLAADGRRELCPSGCSSS